MVNRSIGLEERHSLLSERQEYALRTEPFQQDFSGFINLVPVLQPDSHHFFDFLPVWLENRDVLVFKEIIEFRIRGDHDGVFIGELDDLPDQILDDHPFIVILQDNRVDGIDVPAEDIQDFGLDDVRNVILRFPVDPDDMLLVGDDPGLDRRGSFAVDHYAIGRKAAFSNDAEKLIAAVVGSDDPDKEGFPSKRLYVLRDVCGSPQPRLLRFQIDHRNGGLGRNPADRSPEIAVEHQVPDDGNPFSIHAGEEIG